ncbi:hypothetical protein [Bartonella bacilliformis]
MKRIVLVAALCSALSSVLAPVTAAEAERKGPVGLDDLTRYTSETIPRVFWMRLPAFRRDMSSSPSVQKTLKEHVCKSTIRPLGEHGNKLHKITRISLIKRTPAFA